MRSGCSDATSSKTGIGGASKVYAVKVGCSKVTGKEKQSCTQHQQGRTSIMMGEVSRAQKHFV